MLLEGALLIGGESAGAKTVVVLIIYDQADQDPLFGIGKPVYLQTGSIGHSLTTTATEILAIGQGLGLYLGTLRGLLYQKHPHILRIPEWMRVCAQSALLTLLWMITVVLHHLSGKSRASRAATCVVLAAKIACEMLSRCAKCARLMPTISSAPGNHGHI